MLEEAGIHLAKNVPPTADENAAPAVGSPNVSPTRVGKPVADEGETDAHSDVSDQLKALAAMMSSTTISE